MRICVVVGLMLAGCKCREPVKPVEAPRPVRTMTTWLPHEVAAAPEDVYGVPAWSKVFALAFERRVQIGVPSCAIDGGCLGRDPLAIRAEPMVTNELVLGRDEPLAFIGEQVTFLEAPARRAALEKAIDEAMTIDPTSAPVAAILFQNDLWERVDAITAAIATQPGADWAVLEALRTKLVVLMKHVALPRSVLDGLHSNEGTVERQFPQLLAGFSTRDEWFEVVSRSREHGVWSRTTRHAERHGHRVVFRVFVHHPSGRSALEQLVSRWPEPFPEGSRFVITGAPLVRTREGELLVAPFITLLETRQARAQGFMPGSIGALANDVLEGKRSTLVRSLDDTGGLELLRRDALIPVGATCMPDFTSRFPSASTCSGCHGPTGARLTASLGPEEAQFRLTDDASEAANAVAEAKRSAGLLW
ncbi:MAG: hypothetical protein GQE15_00210 [Archangiaceae bacterium]|nr:hypothetical protein [Archangiaceae bacterium]